MKRSLTITILSLSLLTMSFTYFIESDATTDLATQFQNAITAWLELDGELVIEEALEAAEAEAVMRVADASLMGPDTLSISTQKQDDSRQRSVFIATNEVANQRVLRHELGLLLDLRVGTQGIMKASVGSEDSAELSETDLELLSATLNAAKEDINRDGQVDYYDLVALSQAFGASGFDSAADLNEDGIVDREDLALLRTAYVFRNPAVNPPSSSIDESSNQDPDAFDPEESQPASEDPIDEDIPDEDVEGEPEAPVEDQAEVESETPTEQDTESETPAESEDDVAPEKESGDQEDNANEPATNPNDPNATPDSP